MWSALGKYKSIVVSIALFLILDASVLTLNFYISFKIADDAVGVNLAGRQRMLTQRTVKSLLSLDTAYQEDTDLKPHLDELNSSYLLFDQTLKAFDRGGITIGANKTPVSLKQVTSNAGRDALNQAIILWRPYSASINNVISAGEQVHRTTIRNAIEHALSTNIELLGLMNTLTVDLETVATQQAMRLRYVQTAGITLAVINFLIILFHFIGELRRNDQALEHARRETTDILNTVNEGLFLLDQNLVIGQQHSARLTDMFGGKQVANITFAELIGDLLKPRDLETAQRFISLLFRPDIKSNLIKDLNPLNEVEVNLQDSQGGYITRFLSFDFNRVIFKDSIHSILVTVNDVTEKVKLTQQLAEEKEKGEQQLEMLTSILHTNPSTLKRFVQNAFDTFARINGLLKDQSKGDSALQRKLKDMFIEVHNFKGESAALGLETFADYAHQFENDIQQLRNQPKISGNDFLKLTVQLDKLIRYTESVEALAQKLASFSVMSKGTSDKMTPGFDWSHLHDLVNKCAERQDKQVSLRLTGFDETNLDETQFTFINDLAIQFIRNAISHSIETSEQRTHANKPAMASVEARLVSLPNGHFELSVRDDGKGLDYEKIRTKAKASGRWDNTQIDSWSQKQLLNCIFESGFSTSEETTADAGRGVGMDVIRSKVRQHNGKLKIASQFGQNCTFTVTFPNNQQQTAVA